MKIRNIVLSTLAVTALSATFAGAASAATINFDQRLQGASGTLSYDGSGGALIGRDISFSFVSADTVGTQSLDCNSCSLNFTTGSNISEGTNYEFNGGGSFELTGNVTDMNGATVADGSLLSGMFSNGNGQVQFTKLPRNSGSFVGYGTNSVNNDLAGFFGLDSDSIFNFLSTDFSTSQLTFASNGGFSGNVTAADLQTINDVPEPQELAIFGLGVFLLVGGLAYRRKTGAGDLIG